MTQDEPLLEVEGLCVSFGARAAVEAVSDLGFSLAKGEVLGLIGESGSGKTMTGLALLRLLPEGANCVAKSIRFRGKDILRLDGPSFDSLRGRELAMIFQDPVGSFNPVKTIDWHLRGALSSADKGEPGEAGLAGMLTDVGIRDPARVLRSFPHQLSGGMLQRALIAMVFSLRPALVIADEPTTNLDNIVEGQILELIRERQRELGTSLIFVTHDLTIARSICDRIAVMYAGEMVEIGNTEEVLARPRHPYTAGLLKTAESLERRDPVLFEIAGDPSARAHGETCRFSLRCPESIPQCRQAHPALVRTEPASSVRCIRHDR
ncbi:MAG: ABC transporter ATP-binding protein [Hyphomicrobiales bacterium]